MSHDHHHDHGELVELDRGIHSKRACGHPGPVADDHRLLEVRPKHADEVHQREDEREKHDPRADEARERVRRGASTFVEVELSPCAHRDGRSHSVTDGQEAIQHEAEKREKDDHPREERLEVSRTFRGGRAALAEKRC